MAKDKDEGKKDEPQPKPDKTAPAAGDGAPKRQLGATWADAWIETGNDLERLAKQGLTLGGIISLLNSEEGAEALGKALATAGEVGREFLETLMSDRSEVGIALRDVIHPRLEQIVQWAEDGRRHDEALEAARRRRNPIVRTLIMMFTTRNH